MGNRLGPIFLVAPLPEIQAVRALVAPLVELGSNWLGAIEIGNPVGRRRPWIGILVPDSVVAAEAAIAANQAMPYQVELLRGRHRLAGVTALQQGIRPGCAMRRPQIIGRYIIKNLLFRRVAFDLGGIGRDQPALPPFVPILFLAFTKRSRGSGGMGREIDIVIIKRQEIADHVGDLLLSGGVLAGSEPKTRHDRLRIMRLGIENPA